MDDQYSPLSIHGPRGDIVFIDWMANASFFPSSIVLPSARFSIRSSVCNHDLQNNLKSRGALALGGTYADRAISLFSGCSHVSGQVQREHRICLPPELQSSPEYVEDERIGQRPPLLTHSTRCLCPPPGQQTHPRPVPHKVSHAGQP